MRRELTAAVLVGVGIACFAGAYLVRREQTANMVARPEATGDVGAVLVYAQQPSGPVRLHPGRKRVLKRPQPIAFQLSAEGTGPRMVRIELEAGGRRAVLHEEKMTAPADMEMVDYVLDLSDDLPDLVEVIVAVEAPHTMAYESRFPLELVGSDAAGLSRTSSASGDPPSPPR